MRTAKSEREDGLRLRARRAWALHSADACPSAAMALPIARSLPVLETGETLPTLYAKWIDELLSGPIPKESGATCDSCVMCRPERAPITPPVYFDAATKCCTFLPTLPNFLVGAILSDAELADSPGRDSVQRRISAMHAVSPIGVGMTASYEAAYDATKEHHFGRVQSLRCPHYVDEAGGRCGIWRYRNGVCATWFCNHARGAVGKAFWDDLRDLLSRVEQELALWCVLELGLDTSALEKLFYGRAQGRTEQHEHQRWLELDAAAMAEAYREWWGVWNGRERVFYRSCFVLVSQLAWTDVCRIGGQRVHARSELVLRSYKRLLNRELPTRLSVGKVTIAPLDRHSIRVSGYSPYDTVILTHQQFSVLRYFDGGLTSDVLGQIREREQLTLDEDLVRRLSDVGVLRPSAEPHDRGPSQATPP